MIFKSQAQRWLEMQPKHTQEWLRKQAIWHDADMGKAFAVGALVGLLMGLIL